MAALGQAPKPPPPEKKLPLFVAFSLLCHEGEWQAWRLICRGDKVLSRKLMESDIKMILPRSTIIARLDRDMWNGSLLRPELAT